MILFILFFLLPLPLLIWLFIRSKSRKAKWFLGGAMVLFIAFVSFIVIGLWGMDVEDLYGNKQEIFWDAHSGDTIKLVDDETKLEIARGILKKTWHRIHIKTNNTELDINDWIDNEIGAYFIESKNEIKDGEVVLNMLSGTKRVKFSGDNLCPYTLNVKYIGENVILYELATFKADQQMPTVERGIVKFYHVKNDTLFYRNITKGDTLTISIVGESGNRAAKIYRRITNKNTGLGPLDYDRLQEK